MQRTHVESDRILAEEKLKRCEGFVLMCNFSYPRTVSFLRYRHCVYESRFACYHDPKVGSSRLLHITSEPIFPADSGFTASYSLVQSYEKNIERGQILIWGISLHFQI